MNEILEFLHPYNGEIVDFDEPAPESIGSLIRTVGQVDDISAFQVALLGVAEDRNAVENEGCAMAPDRIRNKLFRLKTGSYKTNILDLGNINPGHSVSDTYFALSAVVAYLVKNNIVPLILGGSQDLTFAQYCAYEHLEQTVNIVSIDSSFDLGVPAQEISSRSYLGNIILHQPNYLFNYSNVGYQSYFVGSESVNLMTKLYFDAYRLGNVRSNIDEVEPVIRNADIITFDISSVRQSDAPGNQNASPNGFYGEEICKILRYAGLGDKLSSIGFYEVNPRFDIHNQTSHLTAQMIWYFLDGFSARRKEQPLANSSQFVKYRVTPKDSEHEIIFYKSRRSDKWWMEVPFMDINTKYSRHNIVPCSYRDYQTACNEEIPERWWQTFQKLL